MRVRPLRGGMAACLGVAGHHPTGSVFGFRLMSLPYHSVLTMCFLAIVTGIAAAPAVVIWKLDDPRSVAGLPTEVLGQPAIGGDAAGKFAIYDGRKDGFIVSANPLEGWATFTVQVLFKPDPDGIPAQRFVHLQDTRHRVLTFETRVTADGQWAMDTFLSDGMSHCPLLDMKLLHPTGLWYWAALRYDRGVMTSFVEGRPELTGLVDFHSMGKGRISLGVRLNRVYWFKGAIREIRFYPDALPDQALEHVR